MALNLRKRTAVNYYEPEEPAFDEYIYCEDCSDFVYEYCSIHGPLLVIPDDKVPAKTGFPSYVPRAALTIPHVFLHLAPSIIPGAGLGVFATLTLPRGVRFGPYRGQRTCDVDSTYCWQIYDRSQKALHVVDAGDANRSNWMRYVNCARHGREQNLVAYQYQRQLYYRTIKTIPRFTELMVFYGGEFAHRLHINLNKYNIDESYQDIIGKTTHIIHVSEINVASDVKNDPEKHETPSHVDASCFSDEKFEFIDEETCVNTYNSEQCEEKTIINDDNIDSQKRESIGEVVKPSKWITYEAGKIIIKFNNDVCSLHKCEICHKSFAAKRNMKRHLKLHIAAHKIYSCSECDFTTNNNNNLKRHVLSAHTKRDSIACTKKDNKINTKSFYAIEKQCTLCDFATVSRKQWYIHCSRHTGDVFKCDVCDYTSDVKIYLVRHMRRHMF